MASSSSRAVLLRYDDDLVPKTESRDRWLLGNILMDSFFVREPVSSREPAERGNEDDNAPLSPLLR